MIRDALTIWGVFMLLEAYMNLSSVVYARPLGWLRHAVMYAVSASLVALLGSIGVLMAAVYAALMGWFVWQFPVTCDIWRIQEATKRPALYGVRE